MRGAVAALGLALAGWPLAAVGQTVITPDVAPGLTLGTNVGQAGQVFTISGGTRAGGNLFHSFTQFDLGAGDTARWVRPDAPAINNVINRVTGGDPSRINGTIDSTALPNATFYFVNPAGIVFGPNAQVNVPAAAHFSTAGELRFANGERFAIATPGGSTLSVAAPEAWGFLGGQGDIALQGVETGFAADTTLLSFSAANLGVYDSALFVRGLDLSSVGDGPANLRIGNPLATTGGGLMELHNNSLTVIETSVAGRSLRVNGGGIDIQTTSLTSNGNLFINASENLTGVFSTFAVFSITRESAGAVVIRTPDIFLRDSRIFSDAIGDGGPGQVLVETGNLVFARVEMQGDAKDGIGSDQGLTFLRSTGDLILFDSDIRSNANGIADGGQISIEGKDVEITETRIATDTVGLATGAAGLVTVKADTLLLGTSGTITSTTRGQGAGGNVLIDAGSIVMDLASAIRSDATGSGDAGSVTIVARSIDMDGASITSRAQQATGDAGFVNIQVGRLTMADSTISSGTQTRGAGGAVFVAADSIVLDGNNRRFTSISSDSFGAGDAGDLFIQAKSMVVRNGAFVSSDSLGEGDAGGVALVVDDLLLQNGSSISSDSFSDGDAGDVAILAKTLVVRGGDLEGTFISSDSLSGGDAGTVSIASDSILVENAGSISSDTYAVGEGGRIVVAADTVTVRDAGSIRSRTLSAGNAGSVEIEAKTVTLGSGGAISSAATETSSGNAGNVVLTADTVTVGSNARLTTSTQGDGNAGSVEIAAKTVALSGGGSISSGATDTSSGDAGGVTITADTVTVGAGSRVTTSTQGEGDAGSVFIEAKTLNVNGGTISSSAEVGATGSAQLLVLAAETLNVINGGAISTLSTNPNPAGLITIEAGQLRVDGSGSLIASENQAGNRAFGNLPSGSAGDAGNIFVQADNVTIANGGRISTNSFAGAAGAIEIAIERPGLFILEGEHAPGVIQTSSGPGTGGAITIRDPLAIVSNGGSILALGQQRGANVVIQSRYFIRSTDRSNIIDVDGDFTLETGLYDVSSGITSRDLSVLDASKVLRGQCPAARSTGAVSQLITRPVGPYAREPLTAAPEPGVQTPGGGCP